MMNADDDKTKRASAGWTPPSGSTDAQAIQESAVHRNSRGEGRDSSDSSGIIVPESYDYLAEGIEAWDLTADELAGNPKPKFGQGGIRNPIIVERPMHFNMNGSWTGGHDVAGFVPSQ